MTACLRDDAAELYCICVLYGWLRLRCTLSRLHYELRSSLLRSTRWFLVLITKQLPRSSRLKFSAAFLALLDTVVPYCF